MSLNFWKPGTTGPGSDLDRSAQSEENFLTYAPPKASSYNASERLPIYAHRDKLLYAIEKHGVVIVVGHTGCGKTTQLPQYLLQAGWAKDGRVIACTQPRRIAATSVAARVSQELGATLGQEVGYTIRFEDVSSRENTRILYLTDGMLFREVLVDPLLSRYSVIMRIRKKRPALRLIVSSATLDASKFHDYFSEDGVDEVTVLSLEGRSYPVQIAYLEAPVNDYTQTAAEIVCKIIRQGGTGDVLVFMTGREDIELAIQHLGDMLSNNPNAGVDSLPLYAGLTMEEQMEVFQPSKPGRRKVIFSTNIAEASLTIDGIKFVVDCGLVKIRTYNPTTTLSSLSIIPISIASATQRAGRAGRTSPGICYRLYPLSMFQTLPASIPPEISRSDLLTTILQLKALGINDLVKFDWVTAPPAETILRTLERLHSHGIVDDNGQLTMIGEQISEFPVDTSIAKMLLVSKDFQCSEEILTIAAMVSVQDVFIHSEGTAGALAELEKRKFTAEEGCGKSSAWCKARSLSFRALSRAISIRSQLKKYMERFNVPIVSCNGDAERVLKCITSSYWHNSAQWQADGTYKSVRGNMIVAPHPNSVLFRRKPSTGWVVYHEIEETKKIQINVITEIQPDWYGSFH
ncbi:P-loop containing nucleoside triphosphate hydrolase protein [Panaeolus papilionaceus]|nr:P-loop containing nucleoside triphosphate hydrolase protein [Panaeolus papilionaceus]